MVEQHTGLVVAIFGGGGRALTRRRAITKLLSRVHGIVALVPEDDFPKGAPSTYEIEYLKKPIIDLAFIYPESPGSTTEFGEFLNDASIAPKLRVLVPRRYHPIYGVNRSYLSDAYLKHIVRYGHVYAFDESGRSHFPRSREIIVRICESTRDQKAVGFPVIARPISVSEENAEKLLQQQIDEIADLETRKYDLASLVPWREKTLRIVKRIFGPASDQARQFDSIQFGSRGLADYYTTETELEGRYKRGLARAKTTLESFISELDMF